MVQGGFSPLKTHLFTYKHKSSYIFVNWEQNLDFYFQVVRYVDWSPIDGTDRNGSKIYFHGPLVAVAVIRFWRGRHREWYGYYYFLYQKVLLEIRSNQTGNDYNFYSVD